MSVYAINKVLYQMENDAAFRQEMQRDGLKAIADFALTPEERRALTTGDVYTLFGMGVHPFLMNHLARHHVFGVDHENYQPRIRGEVKPG